MTCNIVCWLFHMRVKKTKVIKIKQPMKLDKKKDVRMMRKRHATKLTALEKRIRVL